MRTVPLSCSPILVLRLWTPKQPGGGGKRLLATQLLHLPDKLAGVEAQHQNLRLGLV